MRNLYRSLRIHAFKFTNFKRNFVNISSQKFSKYKNLNRL